MSKTKKIMPIVHPGEILREEFLPDYGLTAYSLARDLKVPRSRIEAIIREDRRISADTALRLGRYFGTTAQMWMNMQARHDLLTVEADHADEINEIKPRSA